MFYNIGYYSVIVDLRGTFFKGVMARRVEIHTDSQLVVLQYNGEFEAKGSTMKKYLSTLRKSIADFEEVNLIKIGREGNDVADALAKFATASKAIDTRSVILLSSETPSTKEENILAVREGDDWTYQ